MRFVVIGAGAIGGVVGASLHQTGHDILLIARGPHHDAIAASGLRFETPLASVTLAVRVARAPSEVDFGADHVVLLATKSQDTAGALTALRDAAAADTPVVCLQNGVENERFAARLFTHVYGAVVMAPTAHLEPAVVLAYGTTRFGAIDVGRYPEGVDDRCGFVCDALEAAGFDSEPRPDIMRAKHAKLILNLANAVQAVCGTEAGADTLVERVEAEGRAVLTAAGIGFVDDDVADLGGRWSRWGVREIEGRARGGGSTWQSVARRAGSVETDFLNGEIVLRGRQTGVPTPVNALLQQLARETVAYGHEPGWLSPAEVLARLA